MRWWETSVGGAARGRIIGLLRRGERSVEELAAELGVTDNAVRAQLQALEREGIVHQTRIRRAGTVGKPATLYGIPPEAEALLSAAYAPVLTALLASLEQRMTDRQLDALFRDVGRRLAEATADGATRDRKGGGSRAKSLEARARAAAAVLTALGGELDVERTPGGYSIRGHACPLSEAVRVQPRVCHAVEELVAGLTGAEVRGCCSRETPPGSADEADAPAGSSAKCCFEIRRTA